MSATRLRYPAQRLAGEGFVLRPWHRDDLAAVHAGMQDPEVPRWTKIPEGNPPSAVRLYLDWLEPRREAGEELGFRRLELRIDPRNAASSAVAERAGFTREGVLRSFEEHRGERIDLAVWAQLAPGA